MVISQKTWLGLSSFTIITIGIGNILPSPYDYDILIKFLPVGVLIYWFRLWSCTWGRVWILFTTLFVIYSHLSPTLLSPPLMVIHTAFLLVTLFFIEDKEKKERAFHHRQLRTMKALLKQNPPLIQTVDYSQEAILLLNNLGEIINSNPQVSSLLSLPEACLAGKPVFTVLGILPNFQLNNIPENGEFTWLTPGGSAKQLKFRTRLLLEHNTPAGTLITLFDISDVKKQRELSLQIEKLSVISQVSAGLAHEIRNPLTTIKGFMQLITPERWPEAFRPYRQLILGEIQTIEQLLNSFILLTSPSAPQMNRLDLLEVLPSLTKSVQAMSQGKTVPVIFEFPSHPVYIMADREQLLQALLSILNNAIEVSPKGEHVRIHLTEQAGYVSISIIDKGPGIPENLRQRVSEPFYTTHHESIGLGLTIAQQIILNHHGKLTFSSPPLSAGTKVTLDFPSLTNSADNLSA